MRLDVRVALRGFRRTPSFTATALAIPAIAIGMAVAMFWVYDGLLLRPLPVREQDNVVELFTYRGDPNADYYLLREDLPRVAEKSRTMHDIAGVAHWGAPKAPMLDGDRPLALNRTTVTGNFFHVLGARAQLGRFFRQADEEPGAPSVVVISHGTWQKVFGGDPGIVGRRLLEPYARKSYEIIGVAPAGLDYPVGVELWMPAWQPSARLSVIAIARLAAGATPSQAQTEFFDTMRRLYPDRQFEGVHVETFTRAITGDVRPVLVVLAAAVALLLVIACVNVGNLLLLRSAERARELSIRRALGASSAAIARQLVVESVLLGVAGGALGLLVAVFLVDVLIANAPPQLPRIDSIGLAGAPFGIAALITLVAVFFFGVVPALLAPGGRIASPLRFDSRAGTESRARRRLRQVLVASQVALAMVMLAGAGLLARSLDRLQHIPLGYEPEHLSLVTVSFPPSEYADAAGGVDHRRLNDVGDRVMAAWSAVPGITSVTPIVVPPFLGAHIFTARLDREGQSPEELQRNPMVPMEAGGAGFFRTFGIPMLRGRAFTDADDERAPHVAIVSESAARRFWPGDNPVGKRIRHWGADSIAWRTVVGVAGDIRWRALREETPMVYLPWRQAYWQGLFAIRTSGELPGVLPALRRATNEVNPLLAVWEARSMDDALAAPLARPRMSATLLGAFAVVSLLLAAIGLYGVLASVVRAGTRELGIRAALGASPRRLRGAVLSQALVVAGSGAAAGLLIALASSRLLSALLFQVDAVDPVSLAGAGMILLLVAALAAYLPAHRATKVDPVAALRSD